jgi:hypothetical protein
MRAYALRALIGSIALSSLTGIYILIVGGDGDFNGKVLVTALSLSGLSLLVMACGAGLEQGKLGPLPYVGSAAAVTAFLLLMIVIWGIGNQRVWSQNALGISIIGAAIALACLLSIPDLAPRFRWVRAIGFFSDAALVSMLNLFIWDLLDTEGNIPARMTGVFAILLGGTTIAVPVLHRMSSAGDNSQHAATLDSTGIAKHCVACGQPLKGSPGNQFTCSACGTRFRVEFLEKSG